MTTQLPLQLEDEKLNSIIEKINSHLTTTLKTTITTLKSNKFFDFNLDLTNKTNTFQLKTRKTKSTQVGDIVSSYLIKLFRQFSKKPNFSNEENENLTIFQKDFSEKLNFSIEVFHLNDVVSSYEVRNLYVNVYLHSTLKSLIDDLILLKKPENHKDNSYSFQSIATFHSCFPEKFSIPRQGCISQKTKGKIVFDYKLVDKSCIEGIEEYDFFWIIYVFHLHSDFKGSKVSPPKNDNKQRLGIYATRTPHRLNPIGLSLVKLDKIKNGEVYISGIDMVNGTPILDIKPYHHLESVQIEKFKYPNWILSASDDKKIRNTVVFSEEVALKLKDFLPFLEFYNEYDEIYSLIIELLEIDPHSKYTKRKNEKVLYAFYIDKLNVIYNFDALNKIVNVIDVEYVKEYKKIRNKDWLKEKTKEYNL